MDINYITLASRINDIVEREIESKNYSEITRCIEGIDELKIQKKEYVFKHQSIASKKIAVVLSIIMSIGFVYFLFIGIATMFLSKEYYDMGEGFALASMVMLIGNVFLIRRYTQIIKFEKRYKTYCKILEYKAFNLLEDVVFFTGQKENTIVKDLDEAIKDKLIPQGHFSKDNLVFMVSDKAFLEYEKNQASYDEYFQIMQNIKKSAQDEKLNNDNVIQKQYTEKLRELSKHIKDEMLSNKIQKMEMNIKLILWIINIDSLYANDLCTFLGFYVPTMEKIMEEYVGMENKRFHLIKKRKEKKELKKSIDIIIDSFQEISRKILEERDEKYINNKELLHGNRSIGCVTDFSIQSQRVIDESSKEKNAEEILRKALWKKGYRYRKNNQELPGKPDLCLTKYKIAIFFESQKVYEKDWKVVSAEFVDKMCLDEVDRELNMLGWTVIHFYGIEMIKKVDECIKVIEDTIFKKF